MAKNRLHLNFGLETTTERAAFLKEYLDSEEFKRRPLSEEESQTCANYILWGKDPDGLSAVQKGEIQIPTRHKTWDRREDESLDALLDAPAFIETQIYHLTSVPLKASHENFSRSAALQNCPDALRPAFEALFAEIDRTELLLNYYDLLHKKRKTPPRNELLQKFSESERAELQTEAAALSQYQYLKKRHLLVEMRREQFTFRDSYVSTVQRRTTQLPQIFDDTIDFETEILVYPLGIKDDSTPVGRTFVGEGELDPSNFTQADLQQISNFIWRRPQSKFWFDFRELEHVYNLFQLWFDLEDSAMARNFESQTRPLLRTLEYYVEMAGLTEVQKEILDLKLKKTKNEDIAFIINKKHQKSYTSNYISTIFRQKIIKQINDAAKRHETIVRNIFFEENFKRCNTCGRLLLCDGEFFVRKSRAKDGFASRCKKCDRKERERNKPKKLEVQK